MNVAYITEDKANRYLEHSLQSVRGQQVTLMIWGTGDSAPLTFRGNINDMMALFGRITDQLTDLSRHAPYLGEKADVESLDELERVALPAG